MAVFDPEAPETGQQQYLGYSKERRGNLAFGTALEGISDTLGQAIPAVDRSIQEGIKDAVNLGTDTLYEEAGVNAATEVTKSANALPPDTINAQKNLAKLAEARKQGKVSEIHFWTSAQALVQDLRNKYPGYRNEVDAAVSSVLGGSPANQIRNALQQEVNQRKSNAERAAEKELDFLRSRAKYLPSDWETRILQGNPYPSAALKERIYSGEAEDYKNQAFKQKLDLDAAVGKATETQATEVFQGVVDTEVNRMITKGVETATGGEDLLTMINRLHERKTPPTPEELQTLRTRMGELRLRVLQTVDGLSSQPLGGSGKSFNQLMGQENTKKVKDGIISRLSSIEESLVNNQTGLLFQQVNEIEAMKNSDVASVLKSNPEARGLLVARTINGDVGVNYLLRGMMEEDKTGKSRHMQNYLKALVGTTAKEVVYGQPTPLSDKIEQLRAAGKEMTGPMMRDIMKINLNSILFDGASNGQVVDQGTLRTMQKNAVTNLFSPDNQKYLSKWDASQRLQLYQEMSRPEVTAKMLDIKQNHPEGENLWKMYSDWSELNFNAFFQVFANGIRESQTYRQGIDIIYNEDPAKGAVNRFVVIPRADKNLPLPTVGGPLQGFPTVPVALYEDLMKQNALNDIDQFNKALNIMEPIAQGSGKDIKKIVLDLLNGVVEVPKSDYRSALTEAVGEGTKAVGEGAKEVAKKAGEVISEAIDKLGQTPRAPNSRPFGNLVDSIASGMRSTAESVQKTYEDFTKTPEAIRGRGVTSRALEQAGRGIAGAFESRNIRRGDQPREVEEVPLDFWARPSKLESKAAAIFDNIVQPAEAGSAGYNSIYSGQREFVRGQLRGRELTDLTLSEVQAIQELMQRNPDAAVKSQALGRYQFMKDTLGEAIDKLQLDPATTKFSPEVQDRLATYLLERRGFSKWKSGELSDEDFADRLAQEWAGLPLSTGRSYYENIAGNKATISRQKVLEALKAAKTQ